MATRHSRACKRLAIWSNPLRNDAVDMGALEGAALRQHLVHVSHGALGLQAASERAGRLLVAGVSIQSLVCPGIVQICGCLMCSVGCQ